LVGDHESRVTPGIHDKSKRHRTIDAYENKGIGNIACVVLYWNHKVVFGWRSLRKRSARYEQTESCCQQQQYQQSSRSQNPRANPVTVSMLHNWKVHSTGHSFTRFASHFQLIQHPPQSLAASNDGVGGDLVCAEPVRFVERDVGGHDIVCGVDIDVQIHHIAGHVPAIVRYPRELKIETWVRVLNN